MHIRIPTPKNVSTLATTPTLPAVPAHPATPTLPLVATLPATPTDPAVATLPATPTLPAAAMLPTTPMLPATELPSLAHGGSRTLVLATPAKVALAGVCAHRVVPDPCQRNSGIHGIVLTRNILGAQFVSPDFAGLRVRADRNLEDSSAGTFSGDVQWGSRSVMKRSTRAIASA
jgi:hypothetical protein